MEDISTTAPRPLEWFQADYIVSSSPKQISSLLTNVNKKPAVNYKVNLSLYVLTVDLIILKKRQQQQVVEK